MDYLCGYYWQQESNVSLVLKHLIFHDGGIPVVYGCLAEGEESKWFVESMTEWFHEKGLGYCQRGESGMKGLEDSLHRQLTDIPDRVEAAAVFLGVGKYFVLWGTGKQRIWLLNTRFGKPHYRCLISENEKSGEMISGILETGVGLLIANEEFFQGASEPQLVSCLAVKELDREKKVEKRLKELGEEIERKGDRHPAVMLIVRC